jgi:hypothetical protein
MGFEPVSVLGIVKLAVKPLWQWFQGKRKAAQSKTQALHHFYTELADVRDRAVDAIRLLAGEHNRRNDPAQRGGRRHDEYGPIATPLRLEFFGIKSIFEQHYVEFSPEQRKAMAQVFEFADEYNGKLTELRELSRKKYSEISFGFAVGPVMTLSTFVYLTTRLIEQKERYRLAESETAGGVVIKVLDGYHIKLYEVVFGDPKK